ncbi:putative basic proline-rich protein-like [Iris pallida]|uniref:Basic proline-rich protein-like n=1 Tax=Iris pallida TaxID=29817 RepID=A0AAX6EQ11_IRIPA|nr:putative basic proline-rich protein-like [Iris pallida]
MAHLGIAPPRRPSLPDITGLPPHRVPPRDDVPPQALASRPPRWPNSASSSISPPADTDGPAPHAPVFPLSAVVPLAIPPSPWRRNPPTRRRWCSPLNLLRGLAWQRSRRRRPATRFLRRRGPLPASPLAEPSGALSVTCRSSLLAGGRTPPLLGRPPPFPSATENPSPFPQSPPTPTGIAPSALLAVAAPFSASGGRPRLPPLLRPRPPSPLLLPAPILAGLLRRSPPGSGRHARTHPRRSSRRCNRFGQRAGRPRILEPCATPHLCLGQSVRLGPRAHSFGMSVWLPA